MGWKVGERRVGKAGAMKQREARQRDWDRRYGEGQWEIGYVLDGRFIPQEEALETVYYRSYEQHFREHPADLEELIGLAKVLRNPHAEATTSVDLQVPAILEYLRRNGLRLQGREVVDIGSWDGQSSHAVGVRLSPLQIKAADQSKMTLEQFWQERKCLAVWEEDVEHP
jgi:hypothetical protein